nr:PREDICTED: uncharacterized F-box/LRR-repeat protein C02F5.7-like [Bemisia tabaci]
MPDNELVPQSKESHNDLCLEPPELPALPVEVITHILKFLPYSDRKCAGLVNHLWLEASLDPCFVWRQVVIFDHVTLQDNAPPLTIIRNSSRLYHHFVFTDLEICQKMSNFWEERGPEIHSLVINRCDIVERQFVNILMACPNLETLELECCSELLMSGRLFDDAATLSALSGRLAKLKNLKIVTNRYLSDALFNRFIAIAPNVEMLSLAVCPISFHPGLYKKFYSSHVLEKEEAPSENVLTFCNVLRCLIKRAPTIKSLDFTCTLVDSTALTEVAALPNLNLESVSLVTCDQLSNSGILALTQHQKSLRVLDLSSCSRITDVALISICDSLKMLVELSVRNCRAITDLGASNFWKLTSLEKLDFSQCESVTSEGVQNGLCKNQNKTLKSLKMASMSLVDDQTIIKLAECLPNLVHLDLSYCFNAVTDLSVQAIFQHQIWLRVLKLTGCDDVSDAGFTGMSVATSSRVPEVEHRDENPLRISLGSRAEEEIMKDAKRKKAVQKMCELNLSEVKSLARLRGLRELNLNGCNKITDVSLEYAFKFPELQILDLSKCQQITHHGLKFVGLHNPSLEAITLCECFNLTDEGVVLLSKSLRRLKTLNLEGCKQLTDRSIESIIDHCNSLQNLNIRHCSKMTSPNVSRLSSSMHSLQTLFASPQSTSSDFQCPTPPPIPFGKKL